MSDRGIVGTTARPDTPLNQYVYPASPELPLFPLRFVAAGPVAVSAVPEPASIAVLGPALGVLFAAARRSPA
jgi:hypothetical protein